MAKKKKPSEKTEELFTMRMKKSQRAIWEKFLKNSNKRFTKISQLIRYCVNGYIDGFLVEKREQNIEQNRAQLEELQDQKLLDKKLMQYSDTLSKQTKAMNDMMDLLLSGVIKPAKAVQGEITKGQILKALKDKNFTSKGLAKKFELDQAYIISQLTPLIKEGSVGRNAKNEYYLTKKEKTEED